MHRITADQLAIAKRHDYHLVSPEGVPRVLVNGGGRGTVLTPYELVECAACADPIRGEARCSMCRYLLHDEPLLT